MKIKIENGKAEEVVKEAMWLAWKACGGPLGMGFLQDNPGATKEDVWKNIARMGDYPAAFNRAEGEANADYVFGRMMKLRVKYTKDEIDLPDSAPTVDYQGWCVGYRTYQELFEKAATNMETTIS